MKKIIILSIALLAFSFSNAQETKKAKKSAKKEIAKTTTPALPKAEGAAMTFESETIDYGTIEHNADGKREFIFTNNGTKPLIIANAQGSCGCTVPTFPKEPILPGVKASIGVKYATDRVGPFTKTVTLTSNAEGQPTKVLTIKGTVLPDAPAATPETKG